VLFHTLRPVAFGPISLNLPVWASFDWHTAGIAALSAWLIIHAKWNVIPVLAIAAAGGWLLSQLP
jgi:chromate transporter